MYQDKGENSKEGPDEEEGDVSTNKPKSSQAKRNLRKKMIRKMKRQAPKKQEVESDDELPKRFKEHCNSSGLCQCFNITVSFSPCLLSLCN